MTGISVQGLGPYSPRPGPAILAAVAMILLWLLANVVLVAFTAILVAIAFCGLAEPIRRFLAIPRAAAVSLVTVLLVGLVLTPIAAFGNRLWAQFDEIALDIPAAIETLERTIEAHPSGRLLESLAGGTDFSKAAGPVARQIGAFAASVGTVASYVVFMFFGGVYLALDPDRYINGVIYFTPSNYRSRMRYFLDRSGANLRRWLFTQIIIVLVNGVFSTIGLWAFGVQSAVALGIVAGALSVVPYVGTIAAVVIGVLAALAQGPQYAVYAFVVLGSVSFLEGYFVTPYVQNRTLSIPPVVLLFALFVFAVLFGTLGIVLAAPLTVVSIVAIETIHAPSQDRLDEQRHIA